jgi:hypothetical protein
MGSYQIWLYQHLVRNQTETWKSSPTANLRYLKWTIWVENSQRC